MQGGVGNESQDKIHPRHCLVIPPVQAHKSIAWVGGITHGVGSCKHRVCQHGL